MAEQFTVDTASLRAAGTRFAAQSQALATALAALRGGVSGVAGAIGDDDQGQQFRVRYEPAAARLQEALDQMAAGLDRIGEAFRTMADNYEGADAASEPR
jgi:uncharacterized protein YukE